MIETVVAPKAIIVLKTEDDVNAVKNALEWAWLASDVNLSNTDPDDKDVVERNLKIRSALQTLLTAVRRQR